jgi:glutamyl-Q tRNA(Asp) synthetase
MIVTRFAPSPTGLLHLGHAFSALTAYNAAKGGRFVLRIEDLDRTRSKPEFAAAIKEDLAWLGLTWEEPVRLQSQHIPLYQEALQKLDGNGLLYPCFCTRKEIADEVARSLTAPHGPEGALYPGTCRGLSESRRASRMKREPYALRLDVVKAMAKLGSLAFVEWGQGPNGQTGEQRVQPQLLGDVVLARKDMPASYHLAVVVDDARQGMTLIVRGNDLFHATHMQRLLQTLLGLPTPAYQHHGLVLDAEGRKLSKRDPSVTLKGLREAGATSQEVRQMVGFTSRSAL